MASLTGQLCGSIPAGTYFTVTVRCAGYPYRWASQAVAQGRTAERVQRAERRSTRGRNPPCRKACAVWHNTTTTAHHKILRTGADANSTISMHGENLQVRDCCVRPAPIHRPRGRDL